MPKFEIPLLVTIEAASHDEAFVQAEQLAEGVGMTDEVSISAVRTPRPIDVIAAELFAHPDFVVGNFFTPEHFEDKGFTADEIAAMKDDDGVFADVISTEVFELAESYRDAS